MQPQKLVITVFAGMTKKQSFILSTNLNIWASSFPFSMYMVLHVI